MQPPKSDICVICGVRPAETVDHVPPKGFFKGVENAQLRTVPACRPCNNGASSDDEDIRFFISAQVGKQTAATKKLWEDGAHKTILRKTKLREAFVSTAGEMTVVGEDGVPITRVAFRVPISTYQRVFERTTRGLYFFHTGRILPAAVPVEVTMLAGTPSMDNEDIRMLKVETIGEDACVYRWGIVAEDADCSLWIYRLHQTHWAMVKTGAAV